MVDGLALPNSDLEAERLTAKCFTRYLKKQKQLEASYPEFPVEVNDETCENLVPTIQAHFNDDITTFGKEFSNDLDTQLCISKNLKTNEAFNLIMQKAVIIMTESLVSEQKLNEFQAKVSNATARLTKVAVETCKGRTRMSRLFDQIYKFADQAEAETEGKVETIEDYCSRKYVIDNKLINLNIYKVIPNPANLDIDNVNCEDYTENLFKNLNSLQLLFLGNPERAKNQMQKCLFARFSEIHLNNRMMGIFMLQELKINDAQKKLERDKFADEVNKLTIAKCM